MPLKLQQDLETLSKYAFYRAAWSEPELKRYYRLERSCGRKAMEATSILHRWMLTPISLWPINIHHVFQICLSRLEENVPLEEPLILLLQTLPEPPSPEACAIIANHEHDVERGRYEGLVKTTVKFDEIEEAAGCSAELLEDWGKIKSQWRPRLSAEKPKLIRRTLSTERNLREPFQVNWKTRRGRLQALFDAFCYKWNLYGMLGDRPLTMKLSVNITPHGTMIFIPSYWSFDPKRDIRWEGVAKLHRARVTRRQGAVLTEGKQERRALSRKLPGIDRQVKSLGLKGQAKHEYICRRLGWDIETSGKRISRLRKEFSQRGF